MLNGTRHFTDLSLTDAADLRGHARWRHGRKERLKAGERDRPLEGKVLAMVFDKPSTRTRVSSMSACAARRRDADADRHRDAAGPLRDDRRTRRRVLSRYVDIIMMRTTSHDRLAEMSENASVPVINGLTDRHPISCQIMADLMTYEGSIAAPFATGSLLGRATATTSSHSLVEGLGAISPSALPKTNPAVPPGKRPSEPAANYVEWAACAWRRRRVQGKSATEAGDGPPIAWSPTHGCRWARNKPRTRS